MKYSSPEQIVIFDISAECAVQKEGFIISFHQKARGVLLHHDVTCTAAG